MREWRQSLKEQGERRETPMKPQVVGYELNKLLANDAIVTTDFGTNTSWAARYLDMREDMMFVVSGNLATMACGLPYAMAAAAAFPDRQVVAFVGDGGQLRGRTARRSAALLGVERRCAASPTLCCGTLGLYGEEVELVVRGSSAPSPVTRSGQRLNGDRPDLGAPGCCGRLECWPAEVSAYRRPPDRRRRPCGWRPVPRLLACRGLSPPAGCRTSAGRPSAGIEPCLR